jgi:hypothetical protein
MKITKRTAAKKITAYLHHEIGLPELVDWAENALMEGEFVPSESKTIAHALGRVALPTYGPLASHGRIVKPN